MASFLKKLAWLSIIGVPLWFVSAAFGYKFGVWGLGTGLKAMVFNWGKYVLFAGLGLGVLALIASVMSKPRKAGGIFVSLLAIAIPVLGLVKADGVRKTAQSLPFIHDITTDTINPPVFTSAIMDVRGAVKGVNTADYIGKLDGREKKPVADLQRAAYADIAPIVSGDSPALAYEKSLDALRALGFDVVTRDMAGGIIEATDTTFWYGFKDDIIVRVRPVEGGGSIIDMRSLSRVGGSDLGKNASRVRAFTKIIGK
ncbi:MAG: DUF1499 domain-containing protein [Robiginitomaculum sp.]